MRKILFRKLASELTEIELNEIGFSIRKPFGGKTKSYNWNKIENIKFAENKKEIIVYKSDKNIVLKNNNTGWYEFIQNVPQKFVKFDFDFAKDLMNSMEPCGVCGIVAVNESKCIVCGTIAWNKKMTENKIEYLKSKQSEFYSESTKEGFKINPVAEPEHGFNADKNWELYI